MRKSVQGKAKQLIHEMYLAPTRKAALAAYDQFLSSYQTKFPKPANAWRKIKRSCLPFTTFRLNIGRIYEWEAGQERIDRWITQDIDAASRA
jgi:transposase-like protein